MRFLSRKLAEASEKNQIIVTTHSPHFVDSSLLGTRRLSWGSKAGASIWSLPGDLDVKSSGQIEAVMRDPGNREVIFARAVILAEGQTEVGFLPSIAPKLEFDLDSSGISVVDVGGQDGYKRYMTVLQSLGIPFVALKDLPWGDDKMYPPDQFFSLGSEIEDYLDSNGLRDLREEVQKDIGIGKPRVGQAIGERVRREQIPQVFTDLFQAATLLAHRV